MSDKDIEKKRYNNRANKALSDGDILSVNKLTQTLQTPYLFYQKRITDYTNSDSFILEIGAGMGENTEFLLATGASVCASDIAQSSLDVIEKRFDTDKLTTKVADMERLPFADASFDIVCSAGSLSYGDNTMVMNEIYRVLKVGGVFIAVDSLNNNPIYKLNRYVHYLRGSRSKSTLLRMPNLKLLERYRQKFGKIETQFFGSISFVMPLMIKVFGEEVAKRISDGVDRFLGVKRSAFKIVMVVGKV